MAEPELSDADTIRILVATDNHVGYGERDPIRKDDSWKSFDEILRLARKEDVDMVLLAGDLFHENKPSRPAMFQVMRSLRKNCLGMKPVQLQFLSDAVDVFHGAFSHVNYEDPDINISIPVFSIHGNHDDPSGDGNYCSLDLLQVSGLVNYFGRVPEVDNISVKPVLLQKGSTKLALYGISNVRDERMYRTFRDHHVKWFRPNVQTSDWFNLLAVHQNHHAHTATSYLPENALPEWLDLVVWGHEHECLIDPTLNPETGFHVMQPGSSVATSLVPGEAVAKHVAILNVTGKEFKVEKHRIKTVRPFVTREIILAKDDRFKNLAKKKDNRQEITRRLMEVVEEMIEEANQDWASIQEQDEDQDEDDENAERPEPPLPLIRLKVEYTPPEGGQFDCENPQRFSNRFAGKVANTHDVVYFYKKKKIQRKEKIEEISEETIAEMGLSTIEVERLVTEYFEKQTLKILPQAPFNDAVTQFVTKQDKHVMEQFVDDQLTTQVKQMMSLGDDHEDDDAILEIMKKVKAREEKQFKAGELKTRTRIVKPKPDAWDSDLEGHWEDQEGVITILDAQGEKSQPKKAQGRGKAKNKDDDDLEMDLDDDVVEDLALKKPTRGRPAKGAAAKAAPAKAAAAKKAPAKGRGRKAGPFVDEDEDDDIIMDDDDDDEPPAPPPKRGAAATKSQPARSQPTRSRPTRAAAAASTTSKRQTQLNFSSQKGSQQNALEISDDEISDDDDDFETMPTKKTTRKR
ncbi:Double-strand break repair protein mus-23 like [Apiospora arundinis]|uniref:Double-strand break repair protein n=1 Tax=Apiospora arundinis TaxID=335852 RepID=A0ABR2IF66_9PEZI